MGEIVVGVDGSDSSRQALEWAAREAEVRGADLVIVKNWRDPMFGGPGFSAMYETDLILSDGTRVCGCCLVDCPDVHGDADGAGAKA